MTWYSIYHLSTYLVEIVQLPSIPLYNSLYYTLYNILHYILNSVSLSIPLKLYPSSHPTLLYNAPCCNLYNILYYSCTILSWFILFVYHSILVYYPISAFLLGFLLLPFFLLLYPPLTTTV